MLLKGTSGEEPGGGVVNQNGLPRQLRSIMKNCKVIESSAEDASPPWSTLQLPQPWSETLFFVLCNRSNVAGNSGSPLTLWRR